MLVEFLGVRLHRGTEHFDVAQTSSSNQRCCRFDNDDCARTTAPTAGFQQPTPHSQPRIMNKLNAVSAATGCLVVLFLLLSLLLPTWVVGSFKGDGHFGLVQFTVDLNMGDGLWKRNVCFGESAPENLLQKAGLSCSGTQQTKGCGAANLTDDKRKECRMFYAAQTLQILAVICAVLVCANVSGRVGFTLRVAFELVTACLAGMVLALLSHTYLYDNHERVRALRTGWCAQKS
jgi:hypothetical protein